MNKDPIQLGLHRLPLPGPSHRAPLAWHGDPVAGTLAFIELQAPYLANATDDVDVASRAPASVPAPPLGRRPSEQAASKRRPRARARILGMGVYSCLNLIPGTDISTEHICRVILALGQCPRVG